MIKKYSQFRAWLSLTKASIRAMLKSPSAVFFSVAFPLLFIVAFGLMSDGDIKVKLGAENWKKENPVASILNNVSVLKIIEEGDTAVLHKKLRKGDIAAIINIRKVSTDSGEMYRLEFQSSLAAGNEKEIAMQIISSIVDSMNRKVNPGMKKIVEVKELPIIDGRKFRYMDFFLPGMLGFSLLSAGIFGTAFVFFNLRQTLVLKRFYATPIKRINIILAEGTSRILLQLLAAIIIIGVGYFAFDFTLVKGLVTFIEMLVLCFIALVVFLGMGFVISSLAKNEAMIPPIANMITMPQLLLSGVFMSTSNFPEWLQKICYFLPLTQLNNALRAVAFEGKNLWEVWQPLTFLLLWALIVYSIAVKVFRWD